MLHGSKTVLQRHGKSIAIIAGSVMAFLIVVRVAGKPDFKLLFSADVFWLLAGLIAIALSTLFLTRRWHLFLHLFFPPPPIGKTYSFLAFLSLCTMFLPKELVEVFGRSWWLKHNFALPYTEGCSTVFADRFLDVLVLGVILVPSACFVFLGLPLQPLVFCLAGCIAIGAAVLFVFGVRSFLLLYACIKRVSAFVARLRKKKDTEKRDIILPEIPRATLLWAYGFTLLKFLLIIACYWAFARSVGIQADLWTFILVVPIIQFFFLISFTAGGAGFIEAGWYVVLNALGVDAAGISTYLVAQRLFFTAALAITALAAYGFTFFTSTFRKF